MLTLASVTVLNPTDPTVDSLLKGKGGREIREGKGKWREGREEGNEERERGRKEEFILMLEFAMR